jgi:hypothetical protein|tara:strand:+ start:696 stop:908 length:213 start_codon:yes stop_codon:yes gene_type:complete
MTDTTRLHMSRRDRGLIQIGRLQVQRDHAMARVKAATTEAEADIPRASHEMYAKLLATEIATLPADRDKP